MEIQVKFMEILHRKSCRGIPVGVLVRKRYGNLTEETLQSKGSRVGVLVGNHSELPKLYRRTMTRMMVMMVHAEAHAVDTLVAHRHGPQLGHSMDSAESSIGIAESSVQKQWATKGRQEPY